jgi:hypothetical protein
MKKKFLYIFNKHFYENIKMFFLFLVIFIIIPFLMILCFYIVDIFLQYFKLFFIKSYIIVVYYIFSLKLKDVLNVFFFDFVNYIYSYAELRHNSFATSYLYAKQLPNDFYIYLHPKFSYFHQNFGYVDDVFNNNIQGINFLDLSSFFFNTITSSKLINFFELDFFFYLLFFLFF